jgi:thiamine monophosphate synthase
VFIVTISSRLRRQQVKLCQISILIVTQMRYHQNPLIPLQLYAFLLGCRDFCVLGFLEKNGPFSLLVDGVQRADQRAHRATPGHLSLVDSDAPRHSPFLRQQGPYLAVITDQYSCDSDDQLEQALTCLNQAVSTKMVDVVSVRIQKRDAFDRNQERRVLMLAKQLVSWSIDYTFSVVLSSDWKHLLATSGAHGVHAKELNRDCIVEVRSQYPSALIGTSCHSVESAMEAYHTYRADYIFVGTCYLSDSHPEKETADLEGPELPGIIRQKLHDRAAMDLDSNIAVPKVLAIGGIDATNCHIPVQTHGADGVAAIKSVLQAADPYGTVQAIKTSMSRPL